MATVTSQLTRIHDVEGSLTTVAIGGGAGATANTDIFIQGSQSLGRRQSNVTLNGFLLDDGATTDLSASDVHVGLWIWHTHYAVLTALRVRIGSTSANYDEHIVPLTEYPSLGGWIRVWVDISRTPDATGGTALNEASVQFYGPVNSLPTVGGNASNLILDAIDYTTGGLLLTGTSGVFDDFVTADEDNTTNKYGVVSTLSGVIYCKARLTLGSASSLVFSDSNFSIIFPQQNLVADTFMGITSDLQHASTDITLSNGSISSPGTKKADFVVTGTTGVMDITGMTFSGLRIVTLTSKPVVEGCTFNSCGQITAPGTSFTNNSVSGYTGSTDTSALVWDVATDPDGLLDGTTFTKGSGTTHAIEFGTTSPTTMTLTNVTFSGYNASNGQTDSAIHIKRTSGTVTLNIDGGTTPSYKTDGATVVIVSGSVTVSVHAQTVSGTAVASANVLLKAANGGPYPFEDTVTIVNSGTTATVTHTGHGLETNDDVYIEGASLDANNGVFNITVTNANEYTYTMGSAPGSNPTGTILSTFALIKGTTDGSGDISMSRVFSSAQPVTGWVRKSSGSPYYKNALLSGTVSSTAGLALTAIMISDE